MGRKSSSTIQEELYSTPDGTARDDIDDARLFDLDAEKESPFLRAQKRVPVRRGPLPKKTAVRLLWGLLAIAVASVGAVSVAVLYRYGEHSWRFRLESSDNIEMAGLTNVTRSQIMEVMGADIGRNVFYIPLEQRQKQLEQIPWVESASVMRFAPNRIRIQVHERIPVAFARVGARVMLTDAKGVLMELPAKKKYSYPVVIGMSASEPLSTRAARMKIYNQLIGELDSGGARYSEELSEVDLSDPEDVKVLTNDPQGEVLVHLGASNYLERFKIYVAHLREWRQQFAKLESVDLRYERQIIVNPEIPGMRQPAISPASVRAAISAGVKPAALVSRSTPKPSAQRPGKAPSTKAQAQPRRWKKASVTAKRTAPKPAIRKTAVKAASLRASETSPATPRSTQKPSPAIRKGLESR